MMKLWRLLAIAAAVNVTAGAVTSAAQTVLVRNAPPGATLEVVVNDGAAATATISAAGEGSVEFTLPDPGEMDANVYVDACDKLRRVLVIDRSRRPAASGAGCERREVSGIFWVRRVNTLVVDVGGPQPSMLLVRGRYTAPRPAVQDAEGNEVSPPRRPAPTGLTLFGGGGLSKFRDAHAIACGNVTGCSGHDAGLGYTFGGTYWFKRWLGAETAFLKPRKVTAAGGDTFKFNTAFDVDVFTVAGKFAIPAGPVRVYGLAGTNYHQSTLNTTETIALATQAFVQKTHGWGWLLGGGMEGWITPKVALYGELSLAQVKGAAEDKGEGKLEDRLRFIAFGARIRLSR